MYSERADMKPIVLCLPLFLFQKITCGHYVRKLIEKKFLCNVLKLKKIL